MKYLKKHKKKVCYTVVLSLIIAVLSALMPVIFGQILDIVIKKGTFQSREVYLLLGAGLIVGTIIDMLNLFQFRQKNEIANYCERELVVKASGHLLRLPMDAHKKSNSGEMFEKITRAGYYLNMLISQVIFLLLPDFVTILVMIIVLWGINYQLALTVIIIMLLYFFVTFKKAKRLVDLEKNVRSDYENTYKIISDSVDNIATIKASATEDKEEENYYREYLKIVKSNLSLTDEWSKTQFYQATIIGKGSFICIGLALVLLANKELTFGQLVIVFGYLNLIYRPLATLSGNYVVIKKSLVSIERVKELIEEPAENYDGGIIPEKVSGKIEFNKVTYSNGDEVTVLRDINFVAEPGKVIGIVGKSGIGKTTIIELLLRFKNGAREGEITVDGIEIEKLNLSWLRKNIALISQDINLFNKTIKYNIGYGLSHVSTEDIFWAAKIANADEFIEKFPHKLEHNVGKKGEKLSTGQRRKLVIAGAILKKAPIIILDEPIANLDSESASIILESLKMILKDKTVIFISHQYAALKSADEIIVIGDEGKIIERGTHNALVQKKGYYSKLCELQNFKGE